MSWAESSRHHHYPDLEDGKVNDELRDLGKALKDYYQQRKNEETKDIRGEATMTQFSELKEARMAQFEELREIQPSQFEDIKNILQDVRERIGRLEGTMPIFVWRNCAIPK